MLIDFELAGFKPDDVSVAKLVLAVHKSRPYLLSLISIDCYMYVFAGEYKDSVGIIEVMHNLYTSVKLILDSVETPACYVALVCIGLHFQVRDYIEVIFGIYKGCLELVIDKLHTEQLMVIEK